MTKKELIELIAPAIGESENRTNTILNKIVEVLTNEVVKGNKIPLTGFGTFESRKVASRKGVNPRTKESIVIPALTKAKFTPSALLKRLLNNK